MSAMAACSRTLSLARARQCGFAQWPTHCSHVALRHLAYQGFVPRRPAASPLCQAPSLRNTLRALWLRSVCALDVASTPTYLATRARTQAAINPPTCSPHASNTSPSLGFEGFPEADSRSAEKLLPHVEVVRISSDQKV